MPPKSMRKKRSKKTNTQPVKKTKIISTTTPIKSADDNDEHVKNTNTSGQKQSEQSLREADKKLSIDPEEIYDSALPSTSKSSVNQDASSNKDIRSNIPEEQNTLHQDSVNISAENPLKSLFHYFLQGSQKRIKRTGVKKRRKKDTDPRRVMAAAFRRIIQNSLPSNVMANSDDDEIENNFFCVEDTMLSKDLEIIVDDLGALSFPLDNTCIERLIELSTKAKFGRGEATVLDTNVRNTQMIPASQLKITVNQNAMNSLLDRIGKGLKTPEGSSLKLHFHNLLIYGPGQFFKKHKDTEKLEGMVATLVIVLPYPHKGGELIIEHDNKKHLFFGSQNPEIVKCVAFYSDCDHEIKEVTEGYRVAITCNIVLDVQNTTLTTRVDKSLDKEVKKYFEKGATKIVYQLNHSYSEHSLKWSFLKAEDRVCANAFFAVAKKQGRVPCLALANLHEIYNVEDVYYPEDKPTLIDTESELYYWVDEHNVNFKSPLGDEHVDERESFFIKKASKLFKPYEVEESGPTGNEGETADYWYRRACVVLFANKWICYHGFKSAITELHQMTKEEGKEQVLLNKIDAVGTDFNQYNFWTLPDISDMLLDIVIYLNNGIKAEMILTKMHSVLLTENKIDCLIRLENQFDSQTWNKILDVWENVGYIKYHNATKGLSFINMYIEIASERRKSRLVSGILAKAADEYIKENSSTWSFSYKKHENIEILLKLLKLSIELQSEESVKKLIEHVLSASRRSTRPLVRQDCATDC